MKKTKLFLFALLMLISVNLFAQRSTYNVVFKYPDGSPITTLTIDSLRLICIYGTYNGYVIFPTYVTGAYCTHNGYGMYELGWFNGGTFTLPDKKYLVNVQRKIAGNWVTQTGLGSFWIGDFGENIDLKVDKSDTANNLRIWGTQTIVGNKTFTGTNSGTNFTFTYATITNANYYGGYPTINFSASTGKLYLGSYTAGTPLLNGSPLYPNSAVYKSWVQSEINTKIMSLQDSTYQESQNIIRLIPGGIEETGRVYLTYSAALNYAGIHASVDTQMTVVVSGMGKPAQYIDVGGVVHDDTTRLAFDYVHFKALGYVALRFFDMPLSITQTFKGTDYNNIIIDGFTILIASDQETEFDFEGVTFQNCTFIMYSGDISSLEFTSCRFLGTNYFYGFTDNELNFTNCRGNRIYSTSEITRTGTYLISAETPTRNYLASMFFYVGTVNNGSEMIAGLETYNLAIDSNFSLNTGAKMTLTTSQFNCTDGLTDTITFNDESHATHTVIIINGIIKSWTH